MGLIQGFPIMRCFLNGKNKKYVKQCPSLIHILFRIFHFKIIITIFKKQKIVIVLIVFDAYNLTHWSDNCLNVIILKFFFWLYTNICWTFFLKKSAFLFGLLLIHTKSCFHQWEGKKGGIEIFYTISFYNVDNNTWEMKLEKEKSFKQITKSAFFIELC